MSYVEHCKKHGQHHGEICGECYDDLKTENEKLKGVLIEIVSHALIYEGVPEFEHIIMVAQTVPYWVKK